MVLKALDSFKSAEGTVASPLVIPGAELQFQIPNVIALLYSMVVYVDSQFIEFHDQHRYLLEKIFGDIGLARIEAAFDPSLGTNPESTFNRYFRAYGTPEEAQAFWKSLSFYYQAYPNPYGRLRIIMGQIEHGYEDSLWHQFNNPLNP